MGDLEHQRKVVEQSMSADHVVLYPLKDRPRVTGRDADQGNRAEAEQRQFSELRDRAKAIGYRPPFEGEDLIGYRTLVEREEGKRPRGVGPQHITKLFTGTP
jgi:hypothetical protein